MTLTAEEMRALQSHISTRNGEVHLVLIPTIRSEIKGVTYKPGAEHQFRSIRFRAAHCVEYARPCFRSAMRCLVEPDENVAAFQFDNTFLIDKAARRGLFN